MINLDLNLFHWHSDTQTLTAEISSLGLVTLPTQMEVTNNKSKQFRKFKYVRTEKDREGDIQAWHYVGDGHPLKLIIWND